MDSLITAAARALSAGDPLGALKRVALRNDPPALALRGIAMAQLGDFARAKLLLHRAARAFGTKEPLARARCLVAEAEVAFASRDLHASTKTLRSARATLEQHGDFLNAVHARHLEVRSLLLAGRLDQASALLAELDPASLPPPWRAAYELAAAGIAIRRLRIEEARSALACAQDAAQRAGIPALLAEVNSVETLLRTPAARLLSAGAEKLLLLEEVEALFASETLVIDACRNVVRVGSRVITLTTRPVLFALARALAEAWPGDVPRQVLLSKAFGARHADESHRARLRVEIARLRQSLKGMAEVQATQRGFILVPLGAPRALVLAQPVDDEHAQVLALLADGESWSSSALALALGTSQRTVQRSLDALAAVGKVQPYGQGRARRWIMPPVPEFTTTLLLPTPLPFD